MNRTNKTQALAESAVMIALSVVLSFIKFSKLPYGGEVTLASMLPVMLVGVKDGPKWGFASAFVYSLIQLLMSVGEISAWGLSALVLIVCVFFDYIFAYSVLGVASLFGGKSRWNAVLGVSVAIALRFVCHFISGITIWATWADGFRSVMLYSLSYNGAYMLPELILTFIIMVILVQVPQMRKVLNLK